MPQAGSNILLIVPEGIEIPPSLFITAMVIQLLIVPEGIEIRTFLPFLQHLWPFNRTRRN